MTTPSTPSTKRTTQLRLLAFTGLLVTVMIVLAWFVDWREVWVLLVDANKGLLLVASAAMLAGLLAYAVRWYVLLGRKVPMATVFHASNIALAANMILPLRAGEPIRIYAIGRDPNNPVSYAEATSSVVVEKIFEMIMRLITLGLALMIGVDQSLVTIASIVAALALASGAIWWTMTHQEAVLARGTIWFGKLPRVSEEKAHQAIADVLTNLSEISSPRQLAWIMLWSVVTWFFFGLFYFLVIASLDTALPRHSWLQVALGAMALSPPTAPTQPGLFHGSVIVPLTTLGFGITGLTAFTLVAHLLEMFWMIVMALLGMLRMNISAESLLTVTQQEQAPD